jgi:putative transposase
MLSDFAGNASPSEGDELMPPENPNKHRRSIRLPDYDYTQAGAYFITICTHERPPLLGSIVDGAVTLTRSGEIVRKCWTDIPRHFPSVKLDEFVVMPNHLHGILWITTASVAPREGEAFPTKPEDALQTRGGNASPLHMPVGTAPGSIGAIMQNFKSVTTRRINQLNRTRGTSLWQRDFYEHVIRNDESLNEIRQYIIYNPETWLRDEYHAD